MPDEILTPSQRSAALYRARALDATHEEDRARARIVGDALASSAEPRLHFSGSAEATFEQVVVTDTECKLVEAPVPPRPMGQARSVSWAEFQVAKAKSFWGSDHPDARFWRFVVEVASFALGELMAVRAMSLLQRVEVIGEGGQVVGHLRGYQKLHRYEPRAIDTPMTPHRSPYLDVGDAIDWYKLAPAHYRSLFTVTSDALPMLRNLRRSQGYFDEDVVLRSTRLKDLMDRFPEGRILADFKLNLTQLEGRAGSYNFVVTGK